MISDFWDCIGNLVVGSFLALLETCRKFGEASLNLKKFTVIYKKGNN